MYYHQRIIPINSQTAVVTGQVLVFLKLIKLFQPFHLIVYYWPYVY